MKCFLISFFIASCLATSPSALEAVTKEASSAPEEGTLSNDAQDVCDYIANANNHGGLEGLNKPEGIATIDGKSVHYSVALGGASCPGPIVTIAENDIKKVGEKTIRQLHFPRGDLDVTSGKIYIVPFRGMYYTVSIHNGGPEQVVDPLKGPVCGFARHYEPVLVRNDEPELCKAFFDGTLRRNFDWVHLKKDEAKNMIWNRSFSVHFDELKEVDFDGNGRMLRIGHYVAASGGGCGCDQKGGGLSAILDSEFFYSGASSVTAITSGTTNSMLYLKNITFPGYTTSLVDTAAGTTATKTGTIAEYWTGTAQSVFNNAQPPGSLNLPELETPEANDAADVANWVQLNSNPSNWQGADERLHRPDSLCCDGDLYSVGNLQYHRPRLHQSYRLQ